MKHLKYLLMAALVAMPLTACDEDDGPIIEPTPTGTITGTVSAEGAGLSGVSVTLVGATTLSATTGANGAYTFTNVEAGSYGVAIDASNHPGVSFSVTSKTTSITSQGQTSTVDFSGSYIRTAAILGSVTASGAPLAGVSVAVTGGPDNVTNNSVTNAGGEYSATGLRAGTYSVTISNLPTGVTFTATTQSVTVATGESKTAHFPGQAVQLATISGAVTVDNVGTAGVAVALSGGATAATETGPGGAFSFTGLTPGATPSPSPRRPTPSSRSRPRTSTWPPARPAS
jgi:large repetitive protein